MPKLPSRMGSVNSPISWDDIVSPYIAGRKVFLMSSKGFISSFITSIVCKRIQIYVVPYGCRPRRLHTAAFWYV